MSQFSLIGARPELPERPDVRTLTDEPRPRLPRAMRVSLLVLIIAKLVLVSHEEIVPFLHDDQTFALAAANFYWKQGYQPYSHVKPPVYPLFVAGTTMLGLPLRIASELVWAVACVALARAVWRCGVGRVAGVIVGALVLFHPWSIEVMNRVLMDALYAPLLTCFVAALGSGLALTSRRELRHLGIVVAVAGALAAGTRPESEVIYALLVLGALLAAAGWYLRYSDGRLALYRMVVLGLVPLCVVVGLTQAIKAVNYAKIGAWVTGDLEMPGFKSLYHALLSVPPEQPRLDLPIPKDVRLKAYEASPSFARLKPFLDGDQPGHEFLHACKMNTSPPVEGEYGAWTIWALRDAAWRMAGTWRSAGLLDAFYQQAADELREAMRRRTLESRWAPHPFVAPEWGLMLRAAPSAVYRSARLILNPTLMRDLAQDLEPWPLEVFNAVAHRRTTVSKLTTGKDVAGSIWLRPETVRQTRYWQSLAGDIVARASLVGFFLGGAGLIGAAVFIRRALVPTGLYAFGILLMGAVVVRVGLTVLVDMSGIGPQTRYLLPAVPPLLALEAVGIAAGARTLAGLVRQRLAARREAALRPGLARAAAASRPHQLVGQRPGVVDPPQGLDDAPRIDGNGPAGGPVVDKV